MHGRIDPVQQLGRKLADVPNTWPVQQRLRQQPTPVRP